MKDHCGNDKRFAVRRKATLLLITAFHAFLLLPMSPVLAQQFDSRPAEVGTAPQVEHEPPDLAVFAGKPIEIRAAITTHAPLKDLTLYYRPSGQEEYSSVNMTQVKETLYAATISADEVVPPAVEYYIQLSDQAGSIALRGFWFSPLTITVLSTPPAQEGGKISTEEIFPPEDRSPALRTENAQSRSWYKKWWVWTIAGAVIIGAAVMSGGGSGGRGEGGEEAKGSATVSGATP